MPTYTLSINGFTHSVDASDPDKPLLYVLRGMGLTATKFGCGLGQCGACKVLIEGKAEPSCLTTIAAVAGQVGHHARGARIAGGACIRSRPPSSRSRCRNAATARAA